jgi:SulP family sulfate permease
MGSLEPDTRDEQKALVVTDRWRWAPGLAVLAGYSRGWFRADLLAGVTVWAMLVPQSLGYSALAGMPTVAGLYAALGAMALYWLWGSSKDLNVGPESTVAIMLAAVLGPMATPGSDDYVSRAALLGIMVGLVLLIGGIFRLGRIADFLSRPILAGYVFGSGILIVVSQLPDLLGVSVDMDLYLTDIEAVVRELGRTDLATLAVGLVTVAFVLGFKRWFPAVPGALVAIVVFIPIMRFASLDIAVVGEFPSSLPLPGIPQAPMSEVVKLIGPAFAIALLVYPDSVLTGRSLGAVGKYRLDANREFFGVGAANIGAGLLGGFPVNGSQSRSFVAADAGAKSQVANLWAIALVILTLVLLSPVFAYLPSAVLAGIVIVAGFALLEVSEFSKLWQYRRGEFWMSVTTVVAVLSIGMLAGIIVAVVLSLIGVVMRAASPHTAFLGRLPGTDTYRDLNDHPDAEEVAGLVMYRFDAPLFFANSGAMRDEIMGYVQAKELGVAEVLIDLESTPDIDSTGAQVLLELLNQLDELGIGLTLARVRTEIDDELYSSGIKERLAGSGIYLEVDDGVADFIRRTTSSP